MRLARHFRMRCGHLARFALQFAEVHDLEARSLRDRDRGIERVARPGDQCEPRVRQRGVAGLAAFIRRILQRLLNGSLGRDAEALQHSARIRQRRRIGDGRPGGDHRRIVMRHVGNRQRQHRRRVRRAREAPALDAREMFAHGVDRADRCAGAEQGAIHVLLLLQRDAVHGRDPVGRAAAGEQHQHEVVRCGALRHLQRSLRRALARRIGNRMPRFDHLDPPCRAAVAVTRRREPGEALRRQAERVEIVPLRRSRQRGSALARGETDDAARGRRRQVLAKHAIRMRARHGGVEDAAKEGSAIDQLVIRRSSA